MAVETDPLVLLNQAANEARSFSINIPFLRKRPSFSEQREAVMEILKTDGIPEDSIPKSEFDRSFISENQAIYLIARRARNTKLLLAERGKLEAYKPYKWIESAGIPRYLKPTQPEINEVGQFFADQRKRHSDFVDNLTRTPAVFIECGDEFLKETTNVFLFPKGDTSSYETMPLMDVMSFMGATREEKKMVGLTNSYLIRQSLEDKGPYEGIYSKIGRQRITDFFGKPVVFYTGGQVVFTRIDKYNIGIYDSNFEMDEGFMEYLYTKDGPGAVFLNPCAGVVKFEPSTNRLKNIGLEVAPVHFTF